jgi:hypothetical protein
MSLMNCAELKQSARNVELVMGVVSDDDGEQKFRRY